MIGRRSAVGDPCDKMRLCYLACTEGFVDRKNVWNGFHHRQELFPDLRDFPIIIVAVIHHTDHFHSFLLYDLWIHGNCLHAMNEKQFADPARSAFEIKIPFFPKCVGTGAKAVFEGPRESFLGLEIVIHRDIDDAASGAYEFASRFGQASPSQLVHGSISGQGLEEPDEMKCRVCRFRRDVRNGDWRSKIPFDEIDSAQDIRHVTHPYLSGRRVS